MYRLVPSCHQHAADLLAASIKLTNEGIECSFDGRIEETRARRKPLLDDEAPLCSQLPCPLQRFPNTMLTRKHCTLDQLVAVAAQGPTHKYQPPRTPGQRASFSGSRRLNDRSRFCLVHEPYGPDERPALLQSISTRMIFDLRTPDKQIIFPQS